MAVLAYLTKRLAWGAMLLVAITLVVYVLFFVLPVDPTRRAGGRTDAEVFIARRTRLRARSGGSTRPSCGASSGTETSGSGPATGAR